MTACQPDEPAIPPAAGAHRVLLTLQRLAEHPRGVSLDELVARAGRAEVERAPRARRRSCASGSPSRSAPAAATASASSSCAWRSATTSSSDEQALVEPALEALAVALRRDRPLRASRRRRDRLRREGHAVRARRAHDLRDRRAQPRPLHRSRQGAARPRAARPRRRSTRYVRAVRPARGAHRAHDHRAPTALHDELELVRAQGYAVDREESELGINCVAFATFLGSPQVPSGAASVAAVANRTPLSALLDGRRRHARAARRSPGRAAAQHACSRRLAGWHAACWRRWRSAAVARPARRGADGRRPRPPTSLSGWQIRSSASVGASRPRRLRSRPTSRTAGSRSRSPRR